MTGPSLPGGDPDTLVTVGRFIEPIAAQLARSRLEADGLTCYVQGGGVGSLLPTATVYPILLQVRDADAERAIEILAEDPASGIPFEEPEEKVPGRPAQETGT